MVYIERALPCQSGWLCQLKIGFGPNPFSFLFNYTYAYGGAGAGGGGYACNVFNFQVQLVTTGQMYEVYF